MWWGEFKAVWKDHRLALPSCIFKGFDPQFSRYQASLGYYFSAPMSDTVGSTNLAGFKPWSVPAVSKSKPEEILKSKVWLLNGSCNFRASVGTVKGLSPEG